MKPAFIFIVLCLSALYVHGQKEVNLEDITKYSGDSIKVCGKIFGGRMFPAKPGRPTWLYMGGLYPSQKLKLIIWGKDQVRFDGSPDFDYLEYTVCVTGVVTIVNGQPEIVLHSDKQIQIQLEEDEDDL